MRLTMHFKRSEFKCKCKKCNCDTVDVKLLQTLNLVRSHFGKPVKINSGHRCPEYNLKVGGKLSSQHLTGKAADFVVKGVNTRAVYDFLDREFPDTFGLGFYANFIHLDVRDKKARWVG